MKWYSMELGTWIYFRQEISFGSLLKQIKLKTACKELVTERTENNYEKKRNKTEWWSSSLVWLWIETRFHFIITSECFLFQCLCRSKKILKCFALNLLGKKSENQYLQNPSLRNMHSFDFVEFWFSAEGNHVLLYNLQS